MAKKKKQKAKKGKKPQGAREIIIVKRGAHAERFDERKVYASAYFSCRNAHMKERESERIAQRVSRAVISAIKKEKVILSDRIFHLIVQELKKHSEDASFLYETHRDLS